MAIKIHDRFPGANVRVLAVRDTPQDVEIEFAADPHGSANSHWFFFKVVETTPDAPHPAKLTVTHRFFNTLRGSGPADGCRPVYQPEGQGWYRTNMGTLQTHADGRVDVSWTIPYPSPMTYVAVCFPFGKEELDRSIQKSKGYWSLNSIGLSQGGRVIERLSNDFGHIHGKASGVYIVARQRAGDSPGSWVLDGIMDRFARDKKMSCILWAVPFANVDGVVHGDNHSNGIPCDLYSAWGENPARHETQVIQHDMHAWASRCQPLLVLDLHAPGACEADGVYINTPDPETQPEAHQSIKPWAHTFQQSIGPEFAAEDFLRIDNGPLPSASLGAYAQETFKVPTLSLGIPFAICRSTVMTQKAYREIGRSLAKSILERARR